MKISVTKIARYGMGLGLIAAAVICLNAALTPLKSKAQTAWISIPVANNVTGTTGALTATLPANTNTLSKTTYLCDFDVSIVGSAAATVPVTVTGLIGGTKTYQVPAGTVPSTFTKFFNPCVPGSAPNQAISITTTADATATAADVNADGYQY